MSNKHNNAAPYLADQWWVSELDTITGTKAELTQDQYRAVEIARQFIESKIAPAPAVPQGWTDADSDAARLALELECLLLDTENLSVVSKWWASANEALELHRRRLATPAAPSQEPYKDSTPHLSEKEALR